MVRFFSVEDVCDRLDVCRDTIDRMIKRGELEAIKFGRNVRISEREMDRFFDVHRVKSEG